MNNINKKIINNHILLINYVNPPNVEIDFRDACDAFGGCLNTDIFRYGPWVAAILILFEIIFWVSLAYFITKKLIKRQASAPVDRDGKRSNNSNPYPPRYSK